MNVFGFSELTEIMMQRKDQNSTRTGDDLDLSDEEEDLFEDPLEEIPIKHQVCMFTTGTARQPQPHPHWSNSCHKKFCFLGREGNYWVQCRGGKISHVTLLQKREETVVSASPFPRPAQNTLPTSKIYVQKNGTTIV